MAKERKGPGNIRGTKSLVKHTILNVLESNKSTGVSINKLYRDASSECFYSRFSAALTIQEFCTVVNQLERDGLVTVLHTNSTLEVAISGGQLSPVTCVNWDSTTIGTGRYFDGGPKRQTQAA